MRVHFFLIVLVLCVLNRPTRKECVTEKDKIDEPSKRRLLTNQISTLIKISLGIASMFLKKEMAIE